MSVLIANMGAAEVSMALGTRGPLTTECTACAASGMSLGNATLYIRAFNELSNSRGGWESERLVTGTVILPGVGYGDPEKINAFHRLTLERLQGTPGVTS